MLKQVVLTRRRVGYLAQLEERRKKNDDIQQRKTVLQQREAELETAVNETDENTSEEDRTELDAAVDEFENDQQALEEEERQNNEAIAGLEEQIANIDAELAELNERKATPPAPVRPPENESRKDDDKVNTRRKFFGMTIQDKNAPDLVPLYKISDELGMEFATASLHNSFYFVESKNIIHNRPMVARHFEELINEMLKSWSPKKWMRAYFNHGLINYIYGQKRLLPCDMSFDTFFIDPYGDVMPCNGTKDKEVMGNLNVQSWDELWNSKEAEAVRARVRCCDRECWMIGSVSPAMHKYIWVPGLWVVRHKFKALFTKKPYSMYENKIVRDYRDGKVTKEELDKCSTCDLCAEASDGLLERTKK